MDVANVMLEAEMGDESERREEEYGFRLRCCDHPSHVNICLCQYEDTQYERCILFAVEARGRLAVYTYVLNTLRTRTTRKRRERGGKGKKGKGLFLSVFFSLILYSKRALVSV